MKYPSLIILLLIATGGIWLICGGGFSAAQEPTRKIDIKLDREDAIKIAEIVLVKIYGEKVLKQRPWIIEETPETFVINGTFNNNPPPSTNSQQRLGTSKGGVAHITLRRDNLQILHYFHGK